MGMMKTTLSSLPAIVTAAVIAPAVQAADLFQFPGFASLSAVVEPVLPSCLAENDLATFLQCSVQNTDVCGAACGDAIRYLALNDLTAPTSNAELQNSLCPLTACCPPCAEAIGPLLECQATLSCSNVADGDCTLSCDEQPAPSSVDCEAMRMEMLTCQATGCDFACVQDAVATLTENSASFCATTQAGACTNAVCCPDCAATVDTYLTACAPATCDWAKAVATCAATSSIAAAASVPAAPESNATITCESEMTEALSCVTAHCVANSCYQKFVTDTIFTDSCSVAQDALCVGVDCCQECLVQMSTLNACMEDPCALNALKCFPDEGGGGGGDGGDSSNAGGDKDDLTPVASVNGSSGVMSTQFSMTAIFLTSAVAVPALAVVAL